MKKISPDIIPIIIVIPNSLDSNQNIAMLGPQPQPQLGTDLAITPIYPSTPPDKYEEARIQFGSKNKSCLAQWVNLKTILVLNSNWACFSLI